MSQKRKFQALSPSRTEGSENIVIENNFLCGFEQQDEIRPNKEILKEKNHLEDILRYIKDCDEYSDDDDGEYTNQVLKRPKLNVNTSMDSPCSSMEDIEDLTESPPSSSNLDSLFNCRDEFPSNQLLDCSELNEPPSCPSNQISVITQPASSSPEVIDLSSPDHQKHAESSEVVDLTAEPNSPTIVSEVVDLTNETGESLDSNPIILSVNKIFQRQSVIQQRPSCRFQTLAGVDGINDDEIREVSQKSPGNHDWKVSAQKQDDELTKNITCPICFDDANLLKRRKRQLSSTFCGHVFCDTCIKNAIKTQQKCPTCRKKLTLKQIHPLFL